MEPELTTLSDDLVVIHTAGEVHRFDGLEPDTDYEFLGLSTRTLARPEGELLSRICTVNDLHFGEDGVGAEEFDGDMAFAGVVESNPSRLPGPRLVVDEGERPYVDFMNEAAVSEISMLDPDLVVVKGDLTAHGTAQEFQQFLDCYQPIFGERLMYVRGNHEGYGGEQLGDFSTQYRSLRGVGVALLDSVVYGEDHGTLADSQIAWLDEVLQEADRPVLVMAHHHPWNIEFGKRNGFMFGLLPDASERIAQLAGRHPRFSGYFAGHTHRNRVRHFSSTGDVPWVEVASVKDYPGSYAEYKVYETAILQVHHRVSSDEALAWTDRTRALYAGRYPEYAFGSIEDRCFTIDV
ncbi:MAG: metallophosphoesterase [Acidimicrobiales bacterium]